MTAPFLLMQAVGKAETPFHIGDGRSIGVIKYTRPYIPGSAIRGSVGLFLKRISCGLKEGEHHGEGEECVYHRLIEDEEGGRANAVFRYAYPIHIGCGGVFYPSAKTLSVCRNPQCNFIVNTFLTPLSCPQCGRTLRPAPRYQCSKCQKMVNVPVQTFRVTMTSIDRTRNTAAYVIDSEGEKHGTLHSLELIDSGSQFKFEILLDSKAEEQVEILRKALESAVSEDGIGAGKSRGLGKLRIENTTVTEIGPETVHRKAEMSRSEEAVLRTLTPLVTEEEQTLRMETILEAARRSYSQVFRMGKPSLKEPRIDGERFRFMAYGGWSLKENRRRRLRSALEPGSSYHLTGVNHELRLALSALEQCHALGGFKTHGCGQIRIE
mgnify:CR=1 FL=1